VQRAVGIGHAVRNLFALCPVDHLGSLWFIYGSPLERRRGKSRGKNLNSGVAFDECSVYVRDRKIAVAHFLLWGVHVGLGWRF